MKSISSLIPVLMLAALAFAACKSDSSSAVNTPSSTIPTVSTTYTFRDSTGGFGSASDITYRVIESSSTMLVWKQDTVGNRFADTTRYWFKRDATGNLEENPWPVSLIRAGWFMMPYVTKLPVNSTQSVLNGGSFDTVTTSAEGESDGTFSLNGKSYTTQRVKLTITTTSEGMKQSNVYHYQYSPDLGVEVATDEDDWSVQGAPQQTHHLRLKSITAQ